MTMLAVKIGQRMLSYILILSFSTGISRAQSSLPDSTDEAIVNTLRIFANATGNQAGYYNGIQYRRYPDFIHSGHPFFMEDRLIAGALTYDGVRYENVKLQYDQVKDELITTDLQGDNLVQLYKPAVSNFTIDERTFVNISGGGGLRAGYHRVLYNGKSQIVVKETKQVQVKHGETNAETVRSVSTSADYYLKTDKGYKKFNRLKSFLALFGKHRKAVAGFIKDKRLKYRQDKEKVFYQAVTFYDQLTI